LCCIADHCLSFCLFFPLPIVLYCWSLFGILSFFSFGHCDVLLITVCLFCPYFSLPIVLYCWSLFVIFSFFSFAHCAVLLITVWHFVLFFQSAIQHKGQRKIRTK
jgi:hypothetical protein